jgi:outer membrane cobalamin receptor
MNTLSIQMNKRILVTLALWLTVICLQAQDATVYGQVYDDRDTSPMVGVTVRLRGSNTGVVTDEKGAYSITIPHHIANLQISYIGYQTRHIDLVGLAAGERRLVNIQLTEQSNEMDIVVVSATKTEKKIGEEIQSMEVLKGQNITQSSQQLNEAVNKIPGVNMIGRTISIRGGSGFSDATSNRTLLLLDEIPLVSPENGSIRWETLPLEAIDQIELVKGPSTVTNGSQALNALMNVRTINAHKDQPYIKVFANIGSYMPYNNKSWTWFQHSPRMYGGASVVTAHKLGDFDIVQNSAFQQNNGYLGSNESVLFRTFVKFRYMPKRITGLTVSTTVNFAYQWYQDFFRYRNFMDTLNYPGAMPTYDSLVLLSPDTQTARLFAINVNPSISYYDKHENKYSLRTSYYGVRFDNTAGDSSMSHRISFDYSYSRRFAKTDISMLAGLRYSYKLIKSITFGNRYAHYAAPYISIEKTFAKRLTIRVGLSLEYTKLDSIQPRNDLDIINFVANRDSAHRIYSPIKPVFSAGLNWRFLSSSYLRASFSQGYRYPDIAEAFVQTARSGAYVVPNPKLLPESSWIAEIGFKQGFKVSRWVLYADLSGYYSRYSNLIEFIGIKASQSPVPIPARYNGSFLEQAQNISRAQIWGIEVSAIGTGTLFGYPLNFLVGYNYMNPTNLNAKDPQKNNLYYRTSHTAKVDIQTSIKSFIIGVTAIYIGHVDQIDPQVALLPGVQAWREWAGTRGDVILDMRVGYSYHDMITATLIAKNITNHPYTLRPGYIEPPASLTMQVSYKWHKPKVKSK